MLEQTTIDHTIQKHIMSVLLHQKFARFRDLRPKNVDTNLYSYHLKMLQKQRFVVKTDNGYTLGKKGVLYIDRVTTSTLKIRTQPKIITMLVVQNGNGDLLLYKRDRQPYPDQWTLPYGKLHIEDNSLQDSAEREASEKLGLRHYDLIHAGDCYIRVKDDGEALMTTLAHIFRIETDDIEPDQRQMWIQPHKLSSLELAPAVEQIVARTFFKDPYFFEEFEETW